ncbi:unnamed protein product, partial [Polarella glacialis]
MKSPEGECLQPSVGEPLQEPEGKGPPLPSGKGPAAPGKEPEGKGPPLPSGKGPAAPGKGKGLAAPKGPGKGGKGPPPKTPTAAEGQGSDQKVAALPDWQSPQVSPDWQPDRVVNWQPIRQASRLEGSVWQQVHDALQKTTSLSAGKVPQLPEALVSRFMRKAGAEPDKKSGAGGFCFSPKKAAPKRALPQRSALAADINHALLLRKGIRSPRQLRWVLGPGGSEGADEALPDELLEALGALLAAAAGCEVQLERPLEGELALVKSEAFLRRILSEQADGLAKLQARVQLAL